MFLLTRTHTSSNKFQRQIQERSNEKQKNTTLREQFQNQTEKNRRKMQNRYPNTQIHDCSLFWIGTGTSIKSGGV